MKRLFLLLILCSTLAHAEWISLFGDPNGIKVDTDIEFNYNKETKYINSFEAWVKRPDGVYLKVYFDCRADTMTAYEKGQYVNRTNLDPSSGWWYFYKSGCNIRLP